MTPPPPPRPSPLDHSFTHPQVIIANGHFVVLGWSERTLFLLAEAAQMLSDRDEQGGEFVGWLGGDGRNPAPVVPSLIPHVYVWPSSGEIVVLTEMDEQQMLSEVAIVYPDWRRSGCV